MGAIGESPALGSEMLYLDLDLVSTVLATALPQGFPVLAPVSHFSSVEPEGAWQGSLRI